MYLDEEQKIEIEKNQQMELVKVGENMVSCQCGNIMELVPGQIMKGQKDNKGQLISDEAADHMAKNRIRCDQCEKNFCAKCKSEPYHIG